MKSYDYEAVTYDGAAYCLKHIPKEIGKDETTPIFADSEWDSYPSCDKCWKVFDYVSLINPIGKTAVIIEMAEKTGIPVIETKIPTEDTDLEILPKLRERLIKLPLEIESFQKGGPDDNESLG